VLGAFLRKIEFDVANPSTFESLARSLSNLQPAKSESE